MPRAPLLFLIGRFDLKENKICAKGTKMPIHIKPDPVVPKKTSAAAETPGGERRKLIANEKVGELGLETAQ